jgi:hypothetical protein
MRGVDFAVAPDRYSAKIALFMPDARAMGRISRALLWLFILNLGVEFGAGLYEGRIVFNNWLIASPDSTQHWNAEAARHDNTGLRFWVFVTTVPLSLLTLANLIAAWRASGTLRAWWLAAAVAALADRLFTFFYFIPTMATLMQTPDSAESVAKAALWGNLNYVRHAIVLTAWLLALKAFSFLYRRRSPAQPA